MGKKWKITIIIKKPPLSAALIRLRFFDGCKHRGRPDADCGQIFYRRVMFSSLPVVLPFVLPVIQIKFSYSGGDSKMQHLEDSLSFLLWWLTLILEVALQLWELVILFLASLLIWDPPLYIISPHTLIFGQCQCKGRWVLLGPLHTRVTSQEPWPWNCESPNKSVQRSSQDTSKTT